MRATSPVRVIWIPLRVIAPALAAGILASCSLLIDEQLPSPDCAETQFEPAPELSCQAAVDAAVDSLGSSAAITALSFEYGALCPPNARCVAPHGNAGTVIINPSLTRPGCPSTYPLTAESCS